VKLHDVTQFSAFRDIPQGKQIREAFDAYGFFAEVPNHVRVRDVVRGPDPPDYVICLENRRIGVELTRLNPKVFGQGGHLRTKEFKRWKDAAESDPSPKRQFEWGTFTLRELLEAFESQVKRKATKAVRFARDYDEVWLVFQTESGSPAGCLVQRKFSAGQGHKDSVLSLAGKHLFEMEKTCRSAAPFNYVILFSGPHLLAFLSGKKSYNFPQPDAELIKRGAQASEEFLDRQITLYTVRHRLAYVTSWMDAISVPNF
jgi:hypothetical protein